MRLFPFSNGAYNIKEQLHGFPDEGHQKKGASGEPKFCQFYQTSPLNWNLEIGLYSPN